MCLDCSSFIIFIVEVFNNTPTMPHYIASSIILTLNLQSKNLKWNALIHTVHKQQYSFIHVYSVTQLVA